MLREQEAHLSDLSPAELDRAYTDLGEELLRRKQSVIDSLDQVLGWPRRETKGSVNPDTLGERTRLILEAAGVELGDMQELRYEASSPRASLGPSFSLTWVPESSGHIDEIRIDLHDNPHDSDIVRVGLKTNFSRSIGPQFSHPNSGPVLSSQDRENLVRVFGEGGGKIYQALSTPFSRLALAQELVSVAPKAAAK